MKNLMYLFIFGLMSLDVNAQVGINTSTPRSTFEVRKSESSAVPDGIIPPRMTADSLRLKDNVYGPAQNGAFVHITNPVTTTSLKTENVTSSGYYIYDANYTHSDNSKGVWRKMFSDPSAFAAKGTSGITLLSLGIDLFGSEFRTIVLNSAITKEMGSEFITGNQYVVPETGLYSINYSIRFGQGLSAQLLSNNRPAGVIAKTSTSNTVSLLDYSLFGGLSLLGGTLSVSLSQASVNHIYNLKAGEKLNFGVITGGVNLNLLGDISADIAVYKIR
ncbi:hypothetical protein LUD75_13915 [Epilithonimonas sp. JDS]|uniref:hypothetical protein n=1 Tax=Epilithonimonas sp. JDS TaxID=2902797 RepID=UPI001E32FA1F|nr:hypothetical protein [Epilithonimonas sp. JDS]MCD9855816.1 hypothetical protein [Epilithonimonas sp. JDS]